jgi:signal transduction histidine kinase
MTHLHQLEQTIDELKKNNEYLHQLNIEKNNFISIASHDLQNPITNLRLIAAKFRKTSTNLSEAQNRWVEELDETAQQMSEFIRNVLNINQIEDISTAPILQPYDIIEVLNRILHRFHNQAERKQINLHFETKAPSISLITDLHYLTTIGENLISNAIKFSDFGKSIYVNVEEDNDWVIIKIRDEGPGIKEAEMPLLYGKFQKLSNRPTAGESSSGLGLAIVKEYIAQLKAKIICDSIYAQGTTFTIQLPKCKKS